MTAPASDAGPLLPPFDADAAPFFEGCRQGVLRIPQCSATGRLIFPPRPMSPWAPHAKPGWTTVSGRGTVWSFVVAHPPLLPWYAERAPYNVVLVALDEDPNVRLAGNLVAGPGAGCSVSGAVVGGVCAPGGVPHAAARMATATQVRDALLMAL